MTIPEFWHVWLGATDAASEGTFVWSATGEPLTYSNWYQGEPNDYGGDEDCVLAFVGQGSWNDVPCNAGVQAVVCEFIIV